MGGAHDWGCRRSVSEPRCLMPTPVQMIRAQHHASLRLQSHRHVATGQDAKIRYLLTETIALPAEPSRGRFPLSSRASVMLPADDCLATSRLACLLLALVAVDQRLVLPTLERSTSVLQVGRSTPKSLSRCGSCLDGEFRPLAGLSGARRRESLLHLTRRHGDRCRR